ncbi:Myb-like DNA-binding protein [Phytophthora megakarya]|uniref:Myb-like DNA-binding protein n=1 Tax=Phytophthora megakarya TaxID=4795 RepID=A0A225WCS4_9STRA|nr:Myb-like DNA-binding protein [Phytophthora megakarya]
MNSFHTQVRALSTITTVESNMKDEELRQSTDSESDTYTDDEGSVSSPCGMGTGVWSKEEHAKFLDAIKIYTNGPWKLVAAYVGTRTVRQTMTHAQKYRQKAARRLRGLRTKQALMRMHFGHHVSEESLMQERLRSMSAKHNNYHQFTCEPTPIHYSIPEVTLELPPHARYNCLYVPGTETLAEVTPWIFPVPIEEPACLDATMLDVEEVDLLDDLTASPSLEECATELLKLLF